jgi:CheY-like chemotaxis protein
MSKKVPCIMLIDDNPDDNFFHERVIHKNHLAEKVIVKDSAEDALDYLSREKVTGEPQPDLIFLDINMPRMNGWEFLREYNKLEKNKQGKLIVVILTTSENPDDVRRATEKDIATEFRNKPLTKEMLNELIEKFF